MRTVRQIALTFLLPLLIPGPLIGEQWMPRAQQAEPREEGTPAKILDARQVESLLGKSVLSTSGENVGRIVDVLVDRSGQIRAAVVDFGGFLGVGSRKI